MKKPSRKDANKNVDFALRQLLLEGRVGTQDEICQALQKQGYQINQTKVSRLLNQIGAVKIVNHDGQNIYRLPHEHGLMHELTNPATRLPIKQWLIDIVSNQSLIVIHTTPGAAALIAREIDFNQLNLGILGSIAGDDTIFVAPKDVNKIKQVIDGIKKLLE